MKNIFLAFLTVVASLLTFSACSSIDTEEAVVGKNNKTYRLVLNCDRAGMGRETRANSGWSDGDEIWIRFGYDKTAIARAVYNAQDDMWIMSVEEGEILGTEVACILTYVDHPTALPSAENGYEYAFDRYSQWYYATANCVFNWKEEAVINCTLQPNAQSRVRLHGEPNSTVLVDGFLFLDGFSVKGGYQFYVPNNSIAYYLLQTDSLGYTDYVYPAGLKSNKELVIRNNGQFVKTFDSNVFQPGQTGCIEIPTPETAQQLGWIYTYIGVPILSNVTVTLDDLSAYNATFQHQVLDNGSSNITEWGYIITDAYDSPEGATGSSYNNTIVGVNSVNNLKPYTSYSVRAYAINAYGTGYSEPVIFTTYDIIEPSVTTLDVTGHTISSLTLNGKVNDTGRGEIQQRGFVYSTSNTMPTLYGNDCVTVYVNGSANNMTKEITNLPHNTTYYVRAFAVNETSVGYGEVVTTKTLRVDPNEEDNPWPDVKGANKRR